MANRKVTINIATTANTSGADQAAAAMDKLAVSSNKATTAAEMSGKGASRVGQLAGQAGFQIQDFAVQVGAGTSALTAFSQQAPQLLGAFGPAGAIAGAVVAIGAIAAKVFLSMVDDAKAAGEAAKEAGEDLQEAFEKAGGQAADSLIAKISHQRELTDILAESAVDLIEVQNRKIKSDADLAKSQAKATEEALKYLEATGQIESSEKAIIALRKQTAEAEKNAAIASIEVGIQAQKNAYDQIREQKIGVQEDVDKAQAQVDKLQAEQSALTAQLVRNRASDKFLGDEAGRGEGYVSPQTNILTAKLAKIEKEIEGLFSSIDKAPEKIDKLTEKAFDQAGKVDKAVAEGAIAIDSLEAQFQTAAKTEVIKQTVTDITAGVKELSTEVAKIQPVNDIQKAAKETIMAAVADGELTANEQRDIGASLQILMGTLKVGQGTTLKSLQELVTLNNELISKVAATNSAIKDLRARVNSLTLPVR